MAEENPVKINIHWKEKKGALTHWVTGTLGMTVQIRKYPKYLCTCGGYIYFGGHLTDSETVFSWWTLSNHSCLSAHLSGCELFHIKKYLDLVSSSHLRSLAYPARFLPTALTQHYLHYFQKSGLIIIFSFCRHCVEVYRLWLRAVLFCLSWLEVCPSAASVTN